MKPCWQLTLWKGVTAVMPLPRVLTGCASTRPRDTSSQCGDVPSTKMPLTGEAPRTPPQRTSRRGTTAPGSATAVPGVGVHSSA